MKLWEKGISTDKQIEHFTVGNDRELDLVLAKYDALGSIAHAKMLGEIGLLTEEETDSLVLALEDIIIDIEIKSMGSCLPITPLPCFWIVKSDEVVISSELILSKRERAGKNE